MQSKNYCNLLISGPPKKKKKKKEKIEGCTNLTKVFKNIVSLPFYGHYNMTLTSEVK